MQACPTRFLAQETSVILKKWWPKKSFLGEVTGRYYTHTDLIFNSPQKSQLFLPPPQGSDLSSLSLSKEKF